MPFTLFCHQSSPEEALRFLREHGAAIEGDDSCWEASFFTGGGFLSRKRPIKFTYDRAWCSPPNWPKQLAGMANFVRQFEMAELTRRIMMVLIPRFEFSIGIVTEPEVSKADDQRLEIIHALASHLDCVIFTPGALLDSHFRAFASIDGDVDKDAQVPLCKSDGVSSEPASPESDDEEQQLEPPTPQRVARRLYALIAVVARGLFEMNVNEGREPAYSLEQLGHWVEALQLGDELEPEERALLATAKGQLPEQEIVNSVWRVEGAATLAWALNLAPSPAYDAQVDLDDLLTAIGFLDEERCRQILARFVASKRREAGW